MKPKLNLTALILILTVFFSCKKEESGNYIRYVDPLIGTSRANTESVKLRSGERENNGQTIPAVTAPFGMTQWVPMCFAFLLRHHLYTGFQGNSLAQRFMCSGLWFVYRFPDQCYRRLQVFAQPKEYLLSDEQRYALSCI